MRYASFSFILIFILIFVTFCTGCTNQTAALHALYDNHLQPISKSKSQKIDIYKEKCDLARQRQKLLSIIDH